MATSVKRKGAGSSGKQADLPVGAEHRSTRAAAKKAKCLTDAAVEHSQQQNKKDSIKGSRRSSPDNKPQNVAKMPGRPVTCHVPARGLHSWPFNGLQCPCLGTESSSCMLALLLYQQPDTIMRKLLARPDTGSVVLALTCLTGGDRQAHKSKNTQETQPAKRSYGGSACESLPTEVLKVM